MARDDLRPWLRWMPGWLLLPTVAVVVCLLYPIYAARGLWCGLMEAHQEAMMHLREVRDILKKEESDE